MRAVSYPHHHANIRNELRAKRAERPRPVGHETLADCILEINSEHTPGFIRLSEEAWRRLVELALLEKPQPSDAP